MAKLTPSQILGMSSRVNAIRQHEANLAQAEAHVKNIREQLARRQGELEMMLGAVERGGEGFPVLDDKGEIMVPVAMPGDKPADTNPAK